MRSIKSFILRCPIIASIAILILASTLTAVRFTDLLQGLLGYQAAFYLTTLVEKTIVGLAALLLIAKLGLLKRAGLTKPSPARLIWLVWPVVVLSAINGSDLLFGKIHIDFSQPLVILFYVLFAVSTGFMEEVVCRGFVLTVLLKKFGRTKKGIYQAVILSSVLFGLVHFSNLIMGRASIMAVSTQVVYAIFFGVFFAACFLRFNSLWPLIVTHALFDFMGKINEVAVGSSFGTKASEGDSLVTSLVVLAMTLPLFLYGLLLLRRVPIRQDAAELT